MIRRIKEDDYRVVKSWYEHRARRGWQMPPMDIFPDVGYVAQDKKGDMYYAAWLYLSNSELCVLDWIVGNPASKNRSHLRKLIEFAVYEAKEVFGCKYIMSLFDTNPVLQEDFEQVGFTKGSECSNYIRIL